jgi:hypothetical protein
MKILQILSRMFRKPTPAPVAPKPLPDYLARHFAAQDANHFRP